MKKFSLLLIVLATFIMVLAACGSNNNSKDAESGKTEKVESTETAKSEYEPEDINPDTDVCEICAMAIADDQHATQIVLKNHRSLKFDDLGCLYAWIEENGKDEIGAKFVRDFNTREWVLLENANYVFGEEVETPMAYGIISFNDLADAESYIKENGFGELLTVTDLDDHKWEMMNHEHEHDDSHHDDGHGFHTDGFDMYFTELENVTVANEVQLEVNLTLNKDVLKNARVRYEVWKENEKDNAAWIDANENTGGYYVANYAFIEAGTYHIQIHVEDDADLHEHQEYEVNVKE